MSRVGTGARKVWAAGQARSAWATSSRTRSAGAGVVRLRATATSRNAPGGLPRSYVSATLKVARTSASAALIRTW